MKFRKYMKKKFGEDTDNCTPYKEVLVSSFITKITNRKILVAIIAVFVAIPVFGFKMFRNYLPSINFPTEADTQMILLPATVATNEISTISIPSGTVKANPFLPYKEIKTVVNDVPDTTLMEPPSSGEGDSDAIRVMDTVVSGILYDKYSPSAIINIAGVDYLVKKGDVVNSYKILNIMKNTVTVKLGANVYEAGIGEILTSGNVNNNTVSNLNKKFGGGIQ